MKSIRNFAAYLRSPVVVELVHFLIGGAISTILSYLIYLGLLLILPYRMAYSAAFVIGVFLSYSINTRFVFRRAWSLRALLQYPLVYLFQYALGIVVLSVAVDVFSVDLRIAPLLVVVITVPVTFVATRLILRREASR